MIKTTLAICAASTLFFGLHTAKGAPTPEPLATTASAPPVHCQVPCGIFTDTMRIQMLMEDCTTIEKAMGQLAATPGDAQARQQAIRWVITKEEHAAKIQETVASYWLAQRIKRPTEEAGMAKYHRQLALMHDITVLAMKCKQTLDVDNVQALRTKAKEFSQTYFSKEDLEHLSGHHKEGK